MSLAVVTGASSGIGEACARALAAAGHEVLLGARRTDRLDVVAAGIRDAGGTARTHPLDLADPGSVKEFAAAAAGCDIVVSNAGNVLPRTVVDTDPADFAGQIQVNLIGAQQLIAAVVPAMIERRRGDVVFVTSDVVRLPRPSMSSYVASKWGLEGLARAFQMELEGTGVRASIVRPGPTLTGMGDGWDPEVIGELLDLWKHWGLVRHGGYLSPEGVATAVMAVISAPPGTHLTLVEVEPEAPTR